MAPLPMSSILAANARRLGPDAPALSYGDDMLSWSELDLRSTRRAWALREAGVRPADLVTLALPNGLSLFEFTFALWKLGATPHVVSWRLPRRELAAILEVARPRVVAASDPALQQAFGAIDPATPLTAARDEPLPEVVSKYWKATSSGGSTGRPKIIVAHMPSVYDPETPVVTIPRDERILMPGPLYHNGPFTMSHLSLFKGNTVFGMARFDPEASLRLMAEHRVTWTVMVPTMMLRIWRLPREVRERYDLSALRSVWHGAAHMPVWLKQAWIDWLGPERIFEMYGGTEGQGLTEITGEEWLAHRGSVGRPRTCEVRILDEAQRPLPTGEVGEVYMRLVARTDPPYHYLGAEPRAADDRFESIGDFGWLDSDGYLYLADRRTDMILSGGANIYPAEVESALCEHPGVESAVAVGLPHEDLGAAVHAIVKPHDAFVGKLNEAELRAFVGERLALYKTPRTYEFTTRELRDDAGKVRRTQLRDERAGAS
jgi:bile acid-coenzyme A ligase